MNREQESKGARTRRRKMVNRMHEAPGLYLEARIQFRDYQDARDYWARHPYPWNALRVMRAWQALDRRLNAIAKARGW